MILNNAYKLLIGIIDINSRETWINHQNIVLEEHHGVFAARHANMILNKYKTPEKIMKAYPEIRELLRKNRDKK